MPEGPNIVMLKEKLLPFKNRKVTAATGYAKNVDPDQFIGKILKDIKTWGKHLLLCFPKFTVRVHMGLFGSYRINDRGKRNAALGLTFTNGEVNFYISKVVIIAEPLDDVYDWKADIMNEAWDSKQAAARMKAKPKALLGDILLDQKIFAGSGNIIRNEVMFRCRVHPENEIQDLPDKKLLEIADEMANYACDYYKWSLDHKLNKHLEAYGREMCPRDHIPFHKEDLGKTKRHTYYCNVCEKLYR